MNNILHNVSFVGSKVSHDNLHAPRVPTHEDADGVFVVGVQATVDERPIDLRRNNTGAFKHILNDAHHAVAFGAVREYVVRPRQSSNTTNNSIK